MHRTSNGWIRVYKEKEALWIHDGNPKRPHVLLTSGKHSNGFFNSRPMISDETLLREVAQDLFVLLFVSADLDIVEMINCIVGPQKGATKLAEFFSYQIADYTGKPCFWASPAKNEVGGAKSMVFSEEERDRPSGRFVLLCEDVLTTGGSVGLAEAATVKVGGVVLPFMVVIVNRSGLAEVGDKKIIALVDYPMPTWEPEDCPLCKGKEGSEAIPAKDNWARLNATY